MPTECAATPRRMRTIASYAGSRHPSGTAGTREILECFLEGRPIRDEYLIISGGGLAGTGAHSYKL